MPLSYKTLKTTIITCHYKRDLVTIEAISTRASPHATLDCNSSSPVQTIREIRSCHRTTWKRRPKSPHQAHPTVFLDWHANCQDQKRSNKTGNTYPHRPLVRISLDIVKVGRGRRPYSNTSSMLTPPCWCHKGNKTVQDTRTKKTQIIEREIWEGLMRQHKGDLVGARVSERVGSSLDNNPLVPNVIASFFLMVPHCPIRAAPHCPSIPPLCFFPCGTTRSPAWLTGGVGHISFYQFSGALWALLKAFLSNTSH